MIPVSHLIFPGFIFLLFFFFLLVQLAFVWSSHKETLHCVLNLFLYCLGMKIFYNLGFQVWILKLLSFPYLLSLVMM